MVPFDQFKGLSSLIACGTAKVLPSVVVGAEWFSQLSKCRRPSSGTLGLLGLSGMKGGHELVGIARRLYAEDKATNLQGFRVD